MDEDRIRNLIGNYPFESFLRSFVLARVVFGSVKGFRMTSEAESRFDSLGSEYVVAGDDDRVPNDSFEKTTGLKVSGRTLLGLPVVVDETVSSSNGVAPIF